MSRLVVPELKKDSASGGKVNEANVAYFVGSRLFESDRGPTTDLPNWVRDKLTARAEIGLCGPVLGASITD